MEDLNLELERVKNEIIGRKSKKVLIQLPDGLKPKAKEIVDFLRKHTKARFFIHAGTCFGACDTPHGLKEQDIDLLIQFGHSRFH